MVETLEGNHRLSPDPRKTLPKQHFVVPNPRRRFAHAGGNLAKRNSMINRNFYFEYGFYFYPSGKGR
jgi:hypothetical protein